MDRFSRKGLSLISRTASVGCVVCAASAGTLNADFGVIDDNILKQRAKKNVSESFFVRLFNCINFYGWLNCWLSLYICSCERAEFLKLKKEDMYEMIFNREKNSIGGHCLGYNGADFTCYFISGKKHYKVSKENYVVWELSVESNEEPSGFSKICGFDGNKDSFETLDKFYNKLLDLCVEDYDEVLKEFINFLKCNSEREDGIFEKADNDGVYCVKDEYQDYMKNRLWLVKIEGESVVFYFNEEGKEKMYCAATDEERKCNKRFYIDIMNCFMEKAKNYEAFEIGDIEWNEIIELYQDSIDTDAESSYSGEE